MKSTVCPVVTALDNVNVIVVPEMEIAVIDLLELLTRTAKEDAETPVPSMLSSKFSVRSVGEDVLTLPPVNPGA